MIAGIFTNIYSRTHSSGSVSWMVRWKDPLTKRWISRTAGKSEAEAKIMEARVREALLKGENPNPKGSFEMLLMSDLITEYLDGHRYQGLSKHYAKSVHGMIHNNLIPYFGKMNVEKISKDLLYKFYFSLKENGYSNETIRKHHFLLAIFFENSEDRLAIDNPVRKIKDLNKMFPNTELSRDINFLLPEEIESILNELKKSRSKFAMNLVKFLAHTGLRRSEALNLKWTDIDVPSGFIHVRTSKSGKSRIIPLETEAWEAIHPMLGRGIFIFCDETGKIYDRDAALTVFQRAAKRAGINKRVDLHSLRHSFGSNKIRAGWGLKKVSSILGHSNITITSNIYSHLLDGDLKVRDGVTFEHPSSSDHLAHLFSEFLKVASTNGLCKTQIVDLQQKITEKLKTTNIQWKPLESSSETPIGATHMLRDVSEIKKLFDATKKKSRESDLISDTYPAFKLADSPQDQ